MRNFFIFILAFKNVKGHKLRSFLTMGGVALGVGFIVFLISLGAGLQRISTKEVSNLEALSVMDVTPGKSKIVVINNETPSKILRLGEVEKVLPSLSIPSRIEYGTSAIDSIAYARNLDYLALEELRVDKGSLYKSNDKKEILITTAALRELGIKNSEKIIGEKLKISYSIRSEFLEVGAKEAKKVSNNLKAVGVIKNDDASYIYLPLDIVKEEGVKKYSNLKVKVVDKESVDKVKQKIENLGFKVSAIKNTLDQINQFFKIFQLILLSFGIIAIIIAVIGMFNTLTISLLEKTREVGFMKALGATRKNIYRIFVTEALLIGAFGAIIGTFFGYEVGAILNEKIVALAKTTNNKPVEIFYLPFVYMSYVFISTLFISFITGLYPSYRASRIKALDALRYE